MIRGLLQLAGQHVSRVVGDVARRAAYGAVAVVFLLLALGFAALSLFLWLITVTAPPLAGLAVAGLAFLVATIAALVARTPAAPSAGVVPPRDTPASRVADDDMARLAEEAEALGRRFGRDVGGYPLVLGAFVVGLLLSRRRR